MSPRQIGLLESDAWDQLPGETFVRGFLRNYARLLKVDPEPLLASVSAPTPQPIELPEGSHAEMPAEGSSSSQLMPMLAGGGLLLVAAIAAYFFWPIESAPNVVPPKRPLAPPTAESVPAPPMVSPGPAAPAAAVADPVATAPAVVVEPPSVPAANPAATAVPVVAEKPAPSVRAPEPLAPAASQPAKPAEAAAAPVAPRPFVVVDGPQRALRFTVRELSWVEVHDAGGNTLIAYNFEPGTSRNVRGVAPLEVVVGNASGVDLSVDGEAVDLAARARANVAKLTVE